MKTTSKANFRCWYVSTCSAQGNSWALLTEISLILWPREISLFEIFSLIKRVAGDGDENFKLWSKQNALRVLPVETHTLFSTHPLGPDSHSVGPLPVPLWASLQVWRCRWPTAMQILPFYGHASKFGPLESQVCFSCGKSKPPSVLKFISASLHSI